jgi:hypothetical protein
MLMAIDVAALGRSTILEEMLARLPEPVQVNARNFGNQLRQIGGVEQAWLSIGSHDFLCLLQGQLTLPPGFVQLANGMALYRISKTAVVFGRPGSVTEAVEPCCRTLLDFSADEGVERRQRSFYHWYPSVADRAINRAGFQHQRS